MGDGAAGGLLGPAAKKLPLLSPTVEGRCQPGPLPTTLSSPRNQEIEACVPFWGDAWLHPQSGQLEINGKPHFCSGREKVESPMVGLAEKA